MAFRCWHRDRIAPGDDKTAGRHLDRARGLPDADFLSGALLIGEHRREGVAFLLQSACASGDEPARLFGRCGANVRAQPAVGAEIPVHMDADRIGVFPPHVPVVLAGSRCRRFVQLPRGRK